MTDIPTLTEVYRPGPGLRKLGEHFPEALTHADPGVRFLAHTGLFPAALGARYMDDEFRGGTSRFAAVQEDA